VRASGLRGGRGVKRKEVPGLCFAHTEQRLLPLLKKMVPGERRSLD